MKSRFSRKLEISWFNYSFYRCTDGTPPESGG
jgi:hypothetical protein